MIRLSTNGLERLDAVAADWQTTRSEVVRAILGNALGNPALLKALKATVDREV